MTTKKNNALYDKAREVFLKGEIAFSASCGLELLEHWVRATAPTGLSYEHLFNHALAAGYDPQQVVAFLRETTGKDLFIDQDGDLREPCMDGCPGYGAFDCGRDPEPGLVYDHEPSLEIQACDECRRFVDDFAAHARWVEVGKPDLYPENPPTEGLLAARDAHRQLVEPEGVRVGEELHELIGRVARLARERGWDLARLQDEVFAHFETVEESTLRSSALHGFEQVFGPRSALTDEQRARVRATFKKESSS